MNFGWLDQGVVQHEFGHMIGMIHEHQNTRDNPIQWDKPAVNAALGVPPNNWDQDTIDHNMYTKYDVSQINGRDRKSGEEGKSESVRVDHGGRRIIQKKTASLHRGMCVACTPPLYNILSAANIHR